MHPERGPTRTAPPHARFRCLVCTEFVIGTESGHCPKCGFVPPSAPRAPAQIMPWSILWIAVVVVAIVAVAALIGR